MEAEVRAKDDGIVIFYSMVTISYLLAITWNR